MEWIKVAVGRMRAQPGAYAVLMSHLGHHFHNVALLETALTHRSYVNENSDAGPHNERLEFLGDAVLGLLSAHLLMEASPDISEGELSSIRARLVSEHSLAQLAQELDLGQWLFLGRGEENSGGRYKPSLLADAYEAVIGALYCDGGLDAALSAMRRLIGPRILAQVGQAGGAQDFKSQLQEHAQGKLRMRPRYTLISEEGPGHDKTFEVAVWLGESQLAQAKGKSKREAEQRAAELALRHLRK